MADSPGLCTEVEGELAKGKITMRSLHKAPTRSGIVGVRCRCQLGLGVPAWDRPVLMGRAQSVAVLWARLVSLSLILDPG